MEIQKNIENIIEKCIYFLRRSSCITDRFSTYIMPLIFLKWISSCEISELRQGSILKDLVSIKHDYWKQIELSEQNIKIEVKKILYSIERSEAALRNILINPANNQWDLIDEETLKKIIMEISDVYFDNKNLSLSRFLGDLYQNQISKFSFNKLKLSANYNPPDSLRELLVKCLSPEPGMKVYDPACGSGSLLTEVINQLKDSGKNLDDIYIQGREEDYEMRMVATISLLFCDVDNFEILPKKFSSKEEKYLKEFDIVLCNPSFGSSTWRSDNNDAITSSNPLPKSLSDYNFIQKSIKLLNNRGKAAFIVPHGVLFRGGAEGKIREDIVKDDLIESVIGLPENLFFHTKISTAIIIFNKDKRKDRKNKILFIDSSRKFKLSRGQKVLTSENTADILKSYFEFVEKEGYSRIASTEEISSNDFVLVTDRYVKSQLKKELDLNALIAKVQEIEKLKAGVVSKMDDCLRALEIKV